MKTILKRISAGTLAAVFLATFAVPRSRAVVADLDIVAVANAVVDTHLAALGGEFAVKAGGSSALAASTESLFTQAGAAGAFGAGVTGAAAIGTIAAGVSAFGGGFLLGYEGYQVVTQFVNWLKANNLVDSATSEITIFQTGGSYTTALDGTSLVSQSEVSFGRTYQTQAGSSILFTKVFNDGDNPPSTKTGCIILTTVDTDGNIHSYSSAFENLTKWKQSGFSSFNQTTLRFNYNPISWEYPFYVYCRGLPWHSGSNTNIYVPPRNASPLVNLDKVLIPPPDGVTQKEQKVVYTPPVTWTPPTPTPGQSVLYKPFPNAPDKSIEDIIADVPEAIASSNFKPATTTVIDTPTPEPPPTPEVPPTVNPNPDVEAPDDVTPYTVKIGEVFPFCIPFDLYHMVTMFDAEPEAPHAKWTFSLPWSPTQEYKVEWDLKEFDDLAELCRKLELVLFCVGLAVVTSKLIKW